MNTALATPIRRLLALLRRAALGALIAVIAMGSAGVIYQTAATEYDRRTFTAPGQLIDVGGFRLHLNCLGPRAAGRPTVVLESLAGGFSSYWASIQPLLAEQTRVCAYDRPGYGWSDQAPRPRSLSESAADLHTLLARAGEPGPYLLVGHSIGGMYVRQFAERYPAEVIGMVLLDSAHPLQLERHPEFAAETEAFIRTSAPFPWLARLGLFHLYFALDGELDFANHPQRQHDEIAAVWSSPEFWEQQRAGSAHNLEIHRQSRNLGDLGTLPLLVISAGVGQPAGWAELQAELAGLSSQSEHRTLAEATHASLALDPAHAREVSALIAGMLDAGA